MFRSNDGFDRLENSLNSWLADHPMLACVDIKYQDNENYCSALVMYAEAIKVRE